MTHHSPHVHDLLERLDVPNTAYQYTHRGFARVTLTPLSPAELHTQTQDILRTAQQLENPELTLMDAPGYRRGQTDPVTALPFTLLNLIPEGEQHRSTLETALRRAAQACAGNADALTELHPAARSSLNDINPEQRRDAGYAYEILADLLSSCPPYLDTPLNRARRAYRLRGGYAEITALMQAQGVPFPAADAPTLTLTEAGGAVYDTNRAYHSAPGVLSAQKLAQAWTAYHEALKREHACYRAGAPSGTCHGLSWYQADNLSGGICPHCRHWTPDAILTPA